MVKRLRPLDSDLLYKENNIGPRGAVPRFLVPSSSGRSCAEGVASCAARPCAGDELCIHYGTTDENDVYVDRYYCTRRNPLDSRCEPDFDKDVNSCVEGAACIDEVCVPARAEGNACESASDCLLGLYCPAGRCRPQLAEGESCRNAEDCAPALQCNKVSDRCEARAALGGDCFDDTFACDVGLECQSRPGLVCLDEIDCMDSETACCATPEGGAQCVPDTDQSECTPPQGVCEHEAFAG